MALRRRTPAPTSEVSIQSISKVFTLVKVIEEQGQTGLGGPEIRISR